MNPHHEHPAPGQFKNSSPVRNSNRRRFLKKAFVASIIAGTTNWTPAASIIAGTTNWTPANGNEHPVCSKRDHKYVDVHVHLGQSWNERGEMTPQMILRWMDFHDIGVAWVLPLISPEAWFYPITTEWVLQQTKPFRDRLIPFCVVDPRTGVFGGKNHFLDILQRYKQAGARGFGEHKWGGPIDDPQNIELMRACAETKLPVLFHLDNHRNTDEPGLPGLEKVLQAVPDVQMIGHGPGWWASISRAVTKTDLGGYPKGEVVPGGALDRLLTKYPNLHADLSAGSGHNALRRDLVYAKEFIHKHADQIMFGTDYLAENQVVQQFDLFQKLDLPESIEEKIFRSNALGLINPDESP